VDDVLDIALHLGEVCEQLGLSYVIGGSLASSLHGIPRSTQDVDLVVELSERDVAAFIAALRGNYYLDEAAIREAVARRASFNLVHLGSYFKADVFVTRNDEPSRLQMARARRYQLGPAAGRELVVASPEDVVAQKLYWYALGGGVSERQWGDAIGVLKVAGPSLDADYLRRICAMLDVESLLLRAVEEAGVDRNRFILPR
jgi:hypothetical protein